MFLLEAQSEHSQTSVSFIEEVSLVSLKDLQNFSPRMNMERVGNAFS